MSQNLEYQLVEKPCLDTLVNLGYTYLPPAQNKTARDSLNQVILKDIFIQSIQKINNIPQEAANATYQDILAITDNEEFTNLLRGNYSRNIPGVATKKTIRLIDFLEPKNNTYTVTNQFYIKSQYSRIPDIVIFINGIPLVVIEAKKPFIAKDKTGEAFDQIKQYERDIPRLFYSNIFNIITNGVNFLYGATGATSKYWAEWKDPYPKQDSDFQTSYQKALWCLLEPTRLLDILAHFIVFEKREQKVIKKICRYQQYRAVNKIVDRVINSQHRKGLIWHTQGSGKSLTMVFATLKLKTHRTFTTPILENPNILVLTDRIDLDEQISKTFQACGLPNPTRIDSGETLNTAIHTNNFGLTLLSTIFKFDGSKQPIPHSQSWIILVDECHRTQEKDLGAYLRATLPNACFIGFTGTPIKTTDKDTYKNFSPPKEGYLDRYSIDDAVADGATVPIRYTSRKTEWQVEAKKLDILFDQWFANEPESVKNRIKTRGVSVAELVKHSQRIELLAYDIWAHFRTHCIPEGFKAQIVAIDREAVILYKRALNQIITKNLKQQGFDTETAATWADAMSVPIYSSNQEDNKPSEDSYLEKLRQDLQHYALDKNAETTAINRFTGDDAEYETKVLSKAAPPVYFLIVCNKLLTGFDAPKESVMYLDNPLKEHNLLQAIARTNRVCGNHKEFGLIVDYIGITQQLTEALASYREADVKNAMLNLDVEKAELKTAHAEVMKLVNQIPRNTDNLRQEYDTLIQQLKTVDSWYEFHRKAKTFIKAYDSLSPDPEILNYTADFKWIAGFLPLGTLHFEKKTSTLPRDVSGKIRQMLEEHLNITGISTLCQLRHITDPEFWQDFNLAETQDIQTVAVRKSAELKKIIQEKTDANPLQYSSFSDRILKILTRFETGQLAAAETLKQYEQIIRDLLAEEQAHQSSGLNKNAYGILKILEAFIPPNRTDFTTKLEAAAQTIDALYSSNDFAPPGWHLKEQQRKQLRQQVRALVFKIGLENWKDIPNKVDEYALKHYLKN